MNLEKKLILTPEDVNNMNDVENFVLFVIRSISDKEFDAIV